MQIYAQDISYFKTFVYKFDNVFGPTTSQTKIYEQELAFRVSDSFNGGRSCCIVYGPPYSWKTYTMIGNIRKMKNIETHGVAPRVIRDCFQKTNFLPEYIEASISLQMLEVYYQNSVEKIRDLLNPLSRINLRDSGKTGIVVENISDFTIVNGMEGIKLLQEGIRNAGKREAQGHIMITITITQTDLINGNKRVGCIGLVEMGNYEVSMLSLTRVLVALGENSIHVPYRDTKFTRYSDYILYII